MELLIALFGCVVLPVAIGYAYGRNQEPPLVDPDIYIEWK